MKRLRSQIASNRHYSGHEQVLVENIYASQLLINLWIGIILNSAEVRGSEFSIGRIIRKYY